MTKKRIELIDGLRGIALTLMLIHHTLYDLCAFCGMPWSLFDNPYVNAMQQYIAWSFILLSGVSCRFSHSNTRRGVKVLAIAFGIYLVTLFMDMPIRFGVLHLLGFCMVFYGLTQKVWDSMNDLLMPVFCIVLYIASALAVKYTDVGVNFLWMFGWCPDGFYSADYFPIFPWLFVFLFGTWIGKFIRDGKFPKWFYAARLPFFSAIGRKTLLVYVVHQPVIYGILLLIMRVLK